VKTGFQKINILGTDNSMQLHHPSKKEGKIAMKSIC